MLNLKVRLKQKWFWITLIPLIFLLVDQVIQLWTMVQALTIGEMFVADSPVLTLVIEFIGVLFAVLALIGFPVDLTTDGYGDSARALAYTEPAMNASEEAEADEKASTAKHAK